MNSRPRLPIISPRRLSFFAARIPFLALRTPYPAHLPINRSHTLNSVTPPPCHTTLSDPSGRPQCLVSDSMSCPQCLQHFVSYTLRIDSSTYITLPDTYVQSISLHISNPIKTRPIHSYDACRHKPNHLQSLLYPLNRLMRKQHQSRPASTTTHSRPCNFPSSIFRPIAMHDAASAFCLPASLLFMNQPRHMKKSLRVICPLSSPRPHVYTHDCLVYVPPTDKITLRYM